jgi:hypothetical protein
MPVLAEASPTPPSRHRSKGIRRTASLRVIRSKAEGHVSLQEVSMNVAGNHRHAVSSPEADAARLAPSRMHPWTFPGIIDAQFLRRRRMQRGQRPPGCIHERSPESSTHSFFAGGGCRAVSALQDASMNVPRNHRRAVSSPEADAARFAPGTAATSRHTHSESR